MKTLLLTLFIIGGVVAIGRADIPPIGPTRVTLVNAEKFSGYRFFYGPVDDGTAKRELTEILENHPVDLFGDAKLYVKTGDAKPVVWESVKFKISPQSFIYHLKGVQGEGEKIRVEFEVEKGKAPPAPVRRRPFGMILSGMSIAALGALAVRRRPGGG